MSARPYWAGPYLVVPADHNRRPAPGMQTARVEIPQRICSCEEYGCEWFQFGRTGEDEGFPFVHPAGVRCGDMRGCTPCASPIVQNGRKRLCGVCLPCKAGTANCPCAQRLPHRIPTEQFPLRHVYAITDSRRLVSGSEWKDRVAEGLEARHHILTRGL